MGRRGTRQDEGGLVNWDDVAIVVGEAREGSYCSARRQVWERETGGQASNWELETKNIVEGGWNMNIVGRL